MSHQTHLLLHLLTQLNYIQQNLIRYPTSALVKHHPQQVIQMIRSSQPNCHYEIEILNVQQNHVVEAA